MITGQVTTFTFFDLEFRNEYQLEKEFSVQGMSPSLTDNLDKIKKPGDEVIYRDLDDEMLFVSGLTESGMNIDEKDQQKNIRNV